MNFWSIYEPKQSNYKTVQERIWESHACANTSNTTRTLPECPYSQGEKKIIFEIRGNKRKDLGNLFLPESFDTVQDRMLRGQTSPTGVHLKSKTRIFFTVFERAFKLMKNNVYFIVIALLVAELLKILIYANFMT